MARLSLLSGLSTTFGSAFWMTVRVTPRGECCCRCDACGCSAPPSTLSRYWVKCRAKQRPHYAKSSRITSPWQLSNTSGPVDGGWTARRKASFEHESGEIVSPHLTHELCEGVGGPYNMCAHRHNDQVRGTGWLGEAHAEGTKSIRSARTRWKSCSAYMIIYSTSVSVQLLS